VVTRTRSQASGLVDRLGALGAEVVELPVIAVEDPIDGGEALGRAVDRLVAGDYRWVAFTSSNAVTRVLSRLGDRVVPSLTRWAAVGPGTARTLLEAGRRADLVPEVSVAEELARAFPTPGSTEGTGERPRDSGGPRTRSVLFPRAETVRGALVAGLEAKGWLVDEVVAYRTVAGRPSAEALAAAGKADAVAFTSSSTVERTLALLGSGGIPPVVVTIGPVTSEQARSAGLAVTAEARPHTIDGLVDAVVSACGGLEHGPLP